MIKSITILLSELGQTPDEVALSMQASGHKGHRLSPRRNPVVVFLHSCPGLDAYTFIVTEGRLEIWDGAKADRHFTALPPPVHEFLARFDAGHYPALNCRDSTNAVLLPTER